MTVLRQKDASDVTLSKGELCPLLQLAHSCFYCESVRVHSCILQLHTAVDSVRQCESNPAASIHFAIVSQFEAMIASGRADGTVS